MWNTRKVAIFGAALGALYGVVQAVVYWRGNPDPVALQAAGSVVGGLIGGAIVGALACVIRNRFAG